MKPVPYLHRSVMRRFMSMAAAGAALYVGGCVSVPAPDPDSTLTVAEARRALPAEPVPVRWGGTITAVRNTDSNTTVLEIVSRPLQRGGRPIRDDRTDGRFLAEVDGFLDPEIVRKGRDITVSGSVEELREGRIGEADYRFPVVRVSDYRYWKPVSPTPPPYFAHSYPFGSPFHDDFWHDWPHPPYHRHYRSGSFVQGGVRF